MNNLFDELGLSRNKFYVTYAGNIGVMQGVEVIVHAATLLKNESGIEFVIFGNGSEERKIMQMIEDSELANIHLFPLLPMERISEVYSLGDVSVIPCKAGTGKAGSAGGR